MDSFIGESLLMRVRSYLDLNPVQAGHPANTQEAASHRKVPAQNQGLNLGRLFLSPALACRQETVCQIK